MNICELIKIKRNEKRYTLEQMANLLWCTKSAYEHWEKGRRQWTIDTIVQICEILDLELILNKNGVFIKEDNKMCKVELDLNQKYIEVAKDYENYKIIKVYAKKENLGLEDGEHLSPMVIDKENIVETMKEAIVKFGDDYTEAYAIVDKETNEIIEECIVTSLYTAKSLYYKYYAPALEIFEENTEDGCVAKKEVVYITDKYKVVRNHDTLDCLGISALFNEWDNNVKEAGKVVLKLMRKPFYLYNKDNKHYNMAHYNYIHFDDTIEDTWALELYKLATKPNSAFKDLREEEKDPELSKLVTEIEEDEDRITTETWESFYIGE